MPAGDSHPPSLTVGFVGLGNMGRPMAERLLQPGIKLLVYNRTASKAVPLEELGAQLANRLEELGGCDVVITMLGTDADVEAVYLQPHGLLDSPARPRILVDCSTIAMATSERVESAVSAAGSRFLAAPVAGGPPVVRSGDLAMAVSGERDAYDEVASVLQTLAPRVVYVGTGSVSRAVKICHNLLVAAVLEVAAELSVLAESWQVRRADLLAFIESSAIGSHFLGYKAPLMTSLDFTAAFTGALMQKDLELGLGMASERGVPMPVAQRVLDIVTASNATGRSQLDVAAVLLYLSERAGVTLQPQTRPET